LKPQIRNFGADFGIHVGDLGSAGLDLAGNFTSVKFWGKGKIR